MKSRLTTRLSSVTASRGTLAELYSGRDNGIGLIRLVLALCVVLSHAKPLGFADADLGYYLFGRQTNVGTLAVYGFFVLSGMLITRSARRTSIGRYAWHRALRILPGLWVCLLISALVVAPLMTLREHGDLNGFWSGPGGPFDYLRANWWTGLRTFGIHDVFVETTPWGRLSGVSVFNGALWSLSYEMFCYVVVGVLAVTRVLHHARRFVLFLALGAFFIIAVDLWQAPGLTGPVDETQYSGIAVPLVGWLNYRWVVYLGFLFLLGAVFDLYRERVPINDALGVTSALLFLLSLHLGAFFVVGFPAFAYLLVWSAIRMPRKLHGIGRKHDYSYGIYIYGFLFQQVLASFGANRWGYLPYAASSVAWAVIAAMLSWHLVERHALALKGWTPRLRRRRSASGSLPPGRPTGDGSAVDDLAPREEPLPDEAAQNLAAADQSVAERSAAEQSAAEHPPANNSAAAPLLRASGQGLP